MNDTSELEVAESTAIHDPKTGRLVGMRTVKRVGQSNAQKIAALELSNRTLIAALRESERLRKSEERARLAARAEVTRLVGKLSRLQQAPPDLSRTFAKWRDSRSRALPR